jgi:hypothetical protein
MKTQAECWKAILDGKTLYNRDIEVRLIDGNAKTVDSHIVVDFSSPSNWSVSDKFKELKEAHREGAIIQIWNNIKWQIVIPEWHETEKYRIKDGISLSSWNTHKEVIKAHWEGKDIEFKRSDYWRISLVPEWYIDCLYRIKEEPELYYRFKKEHQGTVLFNDSGYVSKDHEDYEQYLRAGWTKCKPKTFDDIGND